MLVNCYAIGARRGTVVTVDSPAFRTRHGGDLSTPPKGAKPRRSRPSQMAIPGGAGVTNSNRCGRRAARADRGRVCTVRTSEITWGVHEGVLLFRAHGPPLPGAATVESQRL